MRNLKESVWIISLVLAAGFVVNYIDRGNISVAAPLIQAEFGLSPVQLGLLFSAFFVAYAFCQVPAGFLVERLNLRNLYAGAFVLWSLTNAAVVFAGSFFSLVLLRVLLSVGESISLPASSKVLATQFREDQRGIANGILDSGYKFGPAIGTLLGGIFLAHFGWRALFLVTGLGGLLWLIPWFWIASGLNGQRWVAAGAKKEPPAAPLSVRQILTSKRAWGTFGGNFCGGYVWYLMLMWLPSYLVTERHFNLSEMGVYGSLLFLSTGIVSVAAGSVTDRMIRRSWSASKVRIRFAVAGLLLSTLIVPAGFASTPRTAFIFLLLAFGSYGLYSSNVWAISQSIAGPLNIGRWSGIQNLIGNLGGVASPAFTGWVVTVTGSFQWAFVVAGAVMVLGALTYLLIVKTLDPIVSLPESGGGAPAVAEAQGTN